MKSVSLGLIALSLAAGGRSSAQHRLPDESIVTLPEFTVSAQAELPEPDPWLHGASPGWQVMSTASPKRTRALLERLFLFDAAVRLVWPLPPPGRGPALHLVICGRRGEFDRFAGRNLDAVPLGGRVSLLLPGNPAVLVIDAYTQELPFAPLTPVASSLRPPAAGVSEPDPEDGTEEESDRDFDDGSRTNVDLVRHLCREYIRHVLSRSTPRLPVWAEEGMAQIFSHGHVTRRTITFARLTPAAETAPGDEPEFHRALKYQPLIPFGEFLATTAQATAVANPIGSLWVQQAHAFAHMCLYGRDGKYRPGFERLVQRATKETITEEVFRECFGFGYREMERALADYIAFPRFAYARFTFGKDSGLKPEPVPELRAATPAEVGIVIANALERAGQPAEALRERRLAHARGVRDPVLLSTLARDELAAGRGARALELSEKAVAAAARDPAPYLAVVRAQLVAAPERIDVGAVRAALRVLFAARQNVPPSREVYLAIADVWERSVVTPSAPHVAVLHEALELFPEDVDLLIATAALEFRAGNRDAGASLLTRALAHPRDATQQNRIEEIRAAFGYPSSP